MASAAGLTIQDYELLPDELALNHELVEGELVDVSGNLGGHNRLRARLFGQMLFFVSEHNLGEVLAEQEFDFEGNGHGPDVTFHTSEKARLFDNKRRVQPFVPDIAIEVAGQRDRFETLLVKLQRYRQCGTKEVVVFSIATRQAFFWSDRGNQILDENATLSFEQIPGFSISLKELFDNV